MPDRVLDVGAGSGILALAALRLGAGIARSASTPTRWRSTAARDERRAQRPRRPTRGPARVRCRPWPTSAIDLVLANLVAAVLVELAPRLADHLAPGGTLLASGIIAGRARTRSSRRSAPRASTVTDRRDDGEWVSAPSRGTADDAPPLLRGARPRWPATGFRCPQRSSARCARSCGWATGIGSCCSPGDGREAICRLEGDACVVEERGRAAGEPRHRLTVVQALLQGRRARAGRPARDRGRASRPSSSSSPIAAIARDDLAAAARAAAGDRARGGRAVGARASCRRSRRRCRWPARSRRDRSCSSSATTAQRLSAARAAARRIVIGPEGGFAPAEVEAAVERRRRSLAGLGPRILRSETVAAAAAAVILSRTGDFA